MMTFIALLRAVNVGGTGKLPMTTLRSICREVGLHAVQTYIASGNVVFDSDQSEPDVKAVLETALERYAGRPMRVMLRNAADMADVLTANPFQDAPRNRTLAVFLDAPPPHDTLEKVANLKGEKIALGKREIYIAYGETMGQSRLRVPAAEQGTARNINTVARLVAMITRAPAA